jgi:hypothetical protein
MEDYWKKKKEKKKVVTYLQSVGEEIDI